MLNLLCRIESASWGLMLLCLLGSPLTGNSQIDFQELKEMNAVFPNEGRIETADVDNDGDLDMLVMGRNFVGYYIYFSKILLNDGAGNFSVLENTPFDGSFGGDADFGDVDSDGDLDVIIVGQNISNGTPTGKLYLNQGNAVFTVADPNPFPAVQDSEVEFFDFNGDPHLDVLISGSTGAVLRTQITKIFIGDGTGNFEEIPDTGLDPLTLVNGSFGDVNGDGVEELFLAGVRVNPSFEEGVFMYSKENGKYKKVKRISYLSNGDSQLADFDGDGDLDYLVSGMFALQNNVEFYLNDGNGGFSKVLDHSFLPPSRNSQIVVEDFDLDGDLDVYLSGVNINGLRNYLYLNDGKGNFTINDYLFPATPSLGSGVGNFDGKGLYDFVFFGAEKQKATLYFNNIELNKAPTVTDILVSGEPLVNHEILCSYTFQDEENDEDQSTFQWYRADDFSGGNRTLIDGANQKTYKINILDLDKFLSVEIIPNDGKLTGEVVRSAWTGPVEVPVPEINLSGNSIAIANGSAETRVENHTYFGGVEFGGTINKIFKLGNNGKANLIIEDIFISGESKEGFSVVNSEALPIVPGETLEFTVKFSFSGLGNQSAVVTVISNDASNSPYTFQVSAYGLNSPPVFGSVPEVDVPENFEGEALNIIATDGEGGPEDVNITYSLSGGEDKELFQIDPKTGSLQFINPPDYESPFDLNKDNKYLIEVTADDGETEDHATVQKITVNVTNVDESPTALCKEGVAVTLNAEGKAKLLAEDLDGGSSDDQGIVERKVEPEEFTCSSIGSVNVTLIITDSGGHTSTCTTTITVIDDISPVISPVDPITLESEVGKCSASIVITPPTVQDNCGTWEAKGTRSDNSLLTDPYPIGNTIITWRTHATDPVGGEVVQLITVEDSEVPVIGSVQSVQRNNDPGRNGAHIEISYPEVTDCGEVSLTGIRNDGRNLNEMFPVGETTILWTATDGKNKAVPVEQKIIVKDTELPVIFIPEDLTVKSSGGNCGSLLTINPPKVTDNCGVSMLPVGTRQDNLPLNDIYPVGTTNITWKVVDINGNWANRVIQTINVIEQEPDEITITGPEVPQIIGTAIRMTAGFTDENFVEARWKILDGGVIIKESIDKLFDPKSGQTSHTFEYLPAGVYTVSLELKYDCGKIANKNYEYVVIYDPNGGFVTGGGWINSPAGAMREPGNYLKEGKANFGFNAKYKTGKTELDLVDGETNFQFKTGDLFFKSSSHEAMSLVVSGGFKATYKGEGTVNGVDGFNFMVTVIDADKTVNYSKDRFRIKIWKGGTVIYDNNLDYPAEDADPATTIEGGSIVIHNAKANNRTSILDEVNLEDNEVDDSLQIFSAYPNPMEGSAVIEFSLSTTTMATLILYDMNGREVQHLFDAMAEKGKVYKIEVLNTNLMEGIYFYRLTTGAGKAYQKQLLVK